LRARGVRVVSLAGAGKWDPRVLTKLHRLMRTEQPDVIQAFLFWANVAARLLRWAGNRCLIISSYHDEIVTEGWFTRLVDRWTMRWTDSIVCCSKAVWQSVKCRIGGGDKACAIIPFGVETARFLEDSNQSVGTPVRKIPVVGTICRLVEPKKGLRYLLEAVAMLNRPDRDPVCELVIVGEGPAEGQLRSLSEQLGTASHVRFTGVRRDIPAMLAQMDMFVLPSLYEGFGIAILEAMAAAKPVVATTVGGIPEFLPAGHCGLLVPPGDAPALAQAIEQVLQQPEKARCMGRLGREHVREHYAIDAVVRQHERLYEQCLVEA